jgi:hypothetical protein
MANQVNNIFYASGNRTDMENFLNQFECNGKGEPRFSLNGHLPKPDNLSPEELEEWKKNNWGVMYYHSAEFDSIIRDDKSIKIRVFFRTIWVAPITWVIKVHELYPDIRMCLSFNDSRRNYLGVVFTELDGVYITRFLGDDALSEIILDKEEV